MRILYLIYGGQSGVIKYLTNVFMRKKINVDILNVERSIHPLHNGRVGLHSFSPKKLVNATISMFQFRSDWKRYILRTSYAFEKMSDYIYNYMQSREGQYDFILQSGCIFGVTSYKPKVPYNLYIDQTYLISKKYPAIEGLNKIDIADKKWEKYEKKVYVMATHIFTMSDYAKTSLMEDYCIDQSKISVIGAGPNLEEIPSCKEKEYEKKRILFVGIDFVRKGGPQLLRAFRKVRKLFPDAELYIVGPEQSIINESNVISKGCLSHEDMSRVYQEASIFVLPSLREPFGLSFLEAMAYQLPCIGSNIEAIPEIIENEKTGFLVEPGDINDLAEKIITSFRFPNMTKKMGIEGYKKIINRFNWNIVADKIIKQASR